MNRRYQNISVVDAELLSATGGGRTYSYSYKLHYRLPAIGDVVIVPFAGRLFPAMVLSAKKAGKPENSSAFVATKLRPVVGVARESNLLRRLTNLSIATMRLHLKSADSSVSLWLPSPFDKNFGVFFFA